MLASIEALVGDVAGKTALYGYELSVFHQRYVLHTYHQVSGNGLAFQGTKQDAPPERRVRNVIGGRTSQPHRDLANISPFRYLSKHRRHLGWRT